MSFLPDPIGILGVNVTPLTIDQLHNYIAGVVRNNRRELILNVNVHCLNLAWENIWLRDFLNEANIVFCDGAGVIIGARILGKHIPERITYADWLYQFSEFSETQDFSLFFLGAKPGVADDAARHLVSIHPNLRIVGTQHGYFDKTASSQENEEIIAKINEAKPNILILGFGMPLQERWLMDNWHTVDANVALTGGAVFDYLSGRLSRAPGWMTDNSLEWLGRLVVEPKRLWRRYLVGNPLFMWRVLNERLLGEARQ